MEHAIKELPSLQDKAQAIALNGYLQDKKALDKALEKELNQIDLKHRKTIEPLLAKVRLLLRRSMKLLKASENSLRRTSWALSRC